MLPALHGRADNREAPPLGGSSSALPSVHEWGPMPLRSFVAAAIMVGMRTRAIGAVAASSVGVLLLATVNGLAAASSAATPDCASHVADAVLPVWARAGFSGSHPRIPYTVSRDGRIAAIVFGYPLLSPPAKNRNNKILWVERHPSKAPTALWIHAQRMAGTRSIGHSVTRVVAHGPGPSIINLPAAGCWRLTLTWSGRSDTLDLRYRSGR